MDQPTIPDLGAARAAIEALVAQRRFAHALETCEAARSGAPGDAWLAMMQGYLLQVLGKSEAAADAAREAIRLGCDEWRVHGVLGMAERALGRHAEAAEALLVAQRMLPSHVDNACVLLEEAAAAYGLAGARAVHEEISRGLSHPRVTACWAKLSFRAGQDEGLPAGFISAPLMSVTASLERTGSTPEFVGTPEDIPVEDPEMIGGPHTVPVRTLVSGYRPYAATLRDATVLARSNIVLMSDGDALNDTAADEAYGRFISFEADQAVLERRGDRLLIDVAPYEMAELEAGIMLCGAASEHYGHWVPEFLFKLTYLERHPRFAELPIIVDSGMPPSHLDYLGRLVSNPVVMLPKFGGLRVGELIVASPPTFFPVYLTDDHQVPLQAHGPFSPDCLRFLQTRILDRFPPSGRRDRLVYLTRRTRGGRKVLNDDEIIGCLAAKGFETVIPEDLTFEQQVRLFQESAAIVGPNGSALVNLIFADPSVKLIVLSQPGFFSFNGFVGPMRALGYDPLFVAGENHSPGEKHANYSVSVARLSEGLAQLGL